MLVFSFSYQQSVMHSLCSVIERREESMTSLVVRRPHILTHTITETGITLMDSSLTSLQRKYSTCSLEAADSQQVWDSLSFLLSLWINFTLHVKIRTNETAQNSSNLCVWNQLPDGIDTLPLASLGTCWHVKHHQLNFSVLYIDWWELSFLFSSITHILW